MDIKPTILGTKSYKVSKVTADILNMHAGTFYAMIKDYFRESRDKTNDLTEAFKTVRYRINNDYGYFMVACFDDDMPKGFMAGDIVSNVGRIVMGYISPKIKNSARATIIDTALNMFDNWALERGVKEVVFYTHRPPGAHRMMLKRGWVHDITAYKKELYHGRTSKSN